MRIAWSEVCPRRAAATIVRSARDSSEGSRTSSSTIGIGLGRYVEVFMAEFDACLRNYCEGRIKESLGWTSPNERRRGLGYAA